MTLQNGNATRFWGMLAFIGVSGVAFGAYTNVTIQQNALDLAKLGGEIAALRVQVDTSKDFALRDQRLDGINSRLATVETKLERTSASVGDLKTKLIDKLGGGMATSPDSQ